MGTPQTVRLLVPGKREKFINVAALTPARLNREAERAGYRTYRVFCEDREVDVAHGFRPTANAIYRIEPW